MKNIILIVILIILVFGLGILFGSKIKKKKTGSLTRAWQARIEKKEENKKGNQSMWPMRRHGQ